MSRQDAEATIDGWNLSWWRRFGRWRLLIGLILLAVLPTVGYLVGRRAETTAESVANATPPPPTPVVATVEEGTIDTDEVFRGRVVSDATPLSATFAQPAVVTDDPARPGDAVSEGESFVEVEDRPFIVLEGLLPLVRDVQPGASGSVVAQLQEALRRLGIYEAEIDGLYGQQTQAAVIALYERLGYPPPPVVGEDEVETAESEVSAGEAAVAGARDAVEQARASGTPTRAARAALSQAEGELAKARERLAVAQSKQGVAVPQQEVLFIPRTPVQLLSTPISVGSVLEGQTVMAEVYSGNPYVVTQASEADSQYFSVDNSVLFRSDSGEDLGRGTIVAVEAPDGTEDSQVGNSQWTVRIEPDDPIDSSLIGTELLVVVPGDEQSGLIVPVTAIRSTSSGVMYVLVSDGPDSSRRAEVDAGLSSGGFVTITGNVAEGDEVVIDE